MPSAVEAHANPQMLKWARLNCGMTLEEAVKTAFNPEKLQKVESGEEHLTFKQLLVLANRYRRPVAFFYLKQPPEEDLITDFRSTNSDRIILSPHLRDAIEQVRENRELAVTYPQYDEKQYDYSYVGSVTIQDDPQEVAEKILSLVGVTTSTRNAWKTEYDALTGWKEAIETLGILVFQVSGMEVGEMRAFSLSQVPYPTIGLNRGDSPLGRIFSLVHELCHIMLERGGLCTATERDETHSSVEKFCNEAAGEALVPRSLLVQNEMVRTHRGEDWTEEELKKLRRTFWASSEVVLRRLLTLDLTNKKYYQKMRNSWMSRPKTKGGPIPPHKSVLTGNSRSFLAIILGAMHDRLITLVDVSKYLGVSLKHLEKIQEAVGGA